MSLFAPSVQAEAVVVKTATIAQYAGSAVATVFGLSPTEWSVVGVIVGIAVAVLGYATNVWFRWQHLKLAKAKATPETRPGELV